MKVTAIKYADSYFFENWVTPDGDRNKRLDIIFRVFCIKHKDKIILVDAGCETMPDFEMSNFSGSVNALKENGISPEDVTDVIITHAHHDHIECVKYFTNATVHIQRHEYETGKEYIPQNFKLNIFDEGYTLYDCIEIIRTGGHTPGSSVVEFTVGEKKYVIVGDECYLRRYFEINSQKMLNENSMNFYKKYSDDKYTLLFCHDE